LLRNKLRGTLRLRRTGDLGQQLKLVTFVEEGVIIRKSSFDLWTDPSKRIEAKRRRMQGLHHTEQELITTNNQKDLSRVLM
jgi:hypothetical protein